jgi:hypothetical protein
MPLLGTLGILSVMFLFYILARLSERLGAVQKMSLKYRYYYVALVFLTVAYLTQLLVSRAVSAPENFPSWLTSLWFAFIAHHLPLTIGVSIGLYVTWHYWSWLVVVKRQK